jgi:flagellar hook assembly protein FlgD
VLLDKQLKAGRHEAEWDGKSNTGRAAPSGVYFCRLRAGKQVLTRKMVLLK